MLNLDSAFLTGRSSASSHSSAASTSSDALKEAQELIRVLQERVEKAEAEKHSQAAALQVRLGQLPWLCNTPTRRYHCSHRGCASRRRVFPSGAERRARETHRSVTARARGVAAASGGEARTGDGGDGPGRRHFRWCAACCGRRGRWQHVVIRTGGVADQSAGAVGAGISNKASGCGNSNYGCLCLSRQFAVRAWVCGRVWGIAVCKMSAAVMFLLSCVMGKRTERLVRSSFSPAVQC